MMETEIVRPEDKQNVDQLIPKSNFYFYCDVNQMDMIEEQGGIFNIDNLLKKFPNHKAQIETVYAPFINDPILRNCVMAFFGRVPERLPNTQPYIQSNTPIRISLSKLMRAKDQFKIFAINVPKYDKPAHIRPEQIDDLIRMEDVWFKHFKASKDPYFRDVPQAAIYCRDGFIPAFACKILEES